MTLGNGQHWWVYESPRTGMLDASGSGLERPLESSGCPKIGGDGFAPPHKYKRHAHAVACQEPRPYSLPGYRPPQQIGDPAMQAPIGLRCVRGAVRTGANIAAAVIATS
jgi:hypothetical protein